MPDRSIVEKSSIIAIPILANIIGWLIMLQFLPVKNNRDILNRLLASFASSCTIGAFTLFYAINNFPGIFDGAHRLMADFGWPPMLGELWIIGAIFAITGIPGWWIIAGVASWLDQRGESMVKALLDNAIKDKN